LYFISEFYCSRNFNNPPKIKKFTQEINSLRTYCIFLIIYLIPEGANGEKGRQNLEEFKTMDMVVSRVRVLQENFIETAPTAPWEMLLGPGVPGPPSVRPKGVVAADATNEISAEGDAEVDFMDQIYDRKEVNRDGDVEGKGEGLDAAAAGGGGGGGGDNTNNALTVSDSATSDAEVLPVLTLGTINLFGHNPPISYTPSPTKGESLPVSVPMQVTVVDNYFKIQQFAAAVRKLSHSASSSSGRSSKGQKA
jgi:hypothetical protein